MLALLDKLNPEQRLAVETTEGPGADPRWRGHRQDPRDHLSHGKSNRQRSARRSHPRSHVHQQSRGRDAQSRLGSPVARWSLSPRSLGFPPFIRSARAFCGAKRPAAGLPRDFAIYDDDDQLAAVKLAMTKLQIEDDSLTPRNVLSRISYAKNHGQTAEQLRAQAFDQDGRRTADIFGAYEKLLYDSKALDFDDLLLRSARLLRESTATREKWQARFQYIHVDEYQDTNRVQYDLMRLLTGPKQNLCVVGDEDQSIYRWRGADVSILLSFFPGFSRRPNRQNWKRNYRSTQNILDAAGAVVANNPERLGKSLSAEKGPGSNLKYLEARDAQAEAEFVAGELERILNDDSDQTCAVEYRTNFQSRAFEEVFRRRGLRYKLVGGFSFYNRAEVKDALCLCSPGNASGG